MVATEKSFFGAQWASDMARSSTANDVVEHREAGGWGGCLAPATPCANAEHFGANSR